MRKLRDVAILMAVALPIEAAILFTEEDQAMLILLVACGVCAALAFWLRGDDPIFYRLCLGVGVALGCLVGAMVVGGVAATAMPLSEDKRRHIADGLGWAIAGCLPFSGFGMILAVFGLSYVDRD